MPRLEQGSDEDLLRLIRAGDEEAFAVLYRRRHRGIYRYALQMSGSSGIAEEVVQETFLTLVREPARYDPARGLVASFLFGVARNHLLRGLERDRRYLPLENSLLDEQPRAVAESATQDPLAKLTRDTEIESLRQAVLRLPPRYREAVVLCDMHEMNYADAAELTGCAVGTIRSRLHRARALLLKKLRGSDRRVSPGASKAERCLT